MVGLAKRAQKVLILLGTLPEVWIEFQAKLPDLLARPTI